MRHARFVIAAAVAGCVFCINAAGAQPAASGAKSAQALRVEDRKTCTQEAAQKNIAKRNTAEYVRKCMADRQAARAKK